MKKQKLPTTKQQSDPKSMSEDSVPINQSVQSEGARNIIYKYSAIASGISLIPLPVVDLFALTALQLKMVAELSKHYNIKFKENAGKMVIGSLLGAMVPESLSRGTFVSFLKMTPVVGPLMGGVTMLVFGGASTYAIGMVFMNHFQSGGTLLDFEVAKARENFMEMYAKGVQLAKSRWTKRKPAVQEEEVINEPVSVETVS